jgi:predicted ATPase
MLTRLEVNGFKNLIGFEINFGPLTCIAGPNGVGKSNIFDAIRFLSLLSDHSIMEAAMGVRQMSAGGTLSDGIHWEPEDLFWTNGIHRAERITLAAEMILEENVHDDFNRPTEATSTFLRYELELGYEKSTRPGGLSRLVLQFERLNYIPKTEAWQHLAFPHSASHFRNQVVKNGRKGAEFISTVRTSGNPTEILIHQDGGSRGPANRAPAASAPRTIVGTSNTSNTPTILAARREMQRWKLLALEPSAMRSPDRFYTDPHVTASGGHLPATLNRLANSSNPDDGHRESTFARVANRLSEMVPVRDVRVATDDIRQLLTLEVQERSEVFLPASSLSDGTLRFLTLSILELDFEFRGVLCMEEPENGIHPARMSAMVELLRDLAVDPNEQPGPDNPLRQVIVATHSPPFVQLQNPADLLSAESVRVRGPGGRPTDTLRCRPLTGTWRSTENALGVDRGAVVNYLTHPPGAQITLEPLLDESLPC